MKQGAIYQNLSALAEWRFIRYRLTPFAWQTSNTKTNPSAIVAAQICAALIYMHQFSRLVVGDVTNSAGSEEMLRQKGVQVEILEDPEGVASYAKYRKEKPDQDLEDWQGLAAVRKTAGSRAKT